jgi:hypothetical protein
MTRQEAIQALITLKPSLKRSVLRHKAKSQWGRIASIAWEETHNTAISDAIWSG